MKQDYAIVQGYDFHMPFRVEDADVTGWQQRFIIYDVAEGDGGLSNGDGTTFDPVGARWVVAFPTDDIPTGSYRYTHDYKATVGGWRQIETGEFRVTDPRTVE